MLGLHKMKNFSVRHKLHVFVLLEYGLARAIIFQCILKGVLLSLSLQMYLLNSVEFCFFLSLNEAV